jgi:hypothetical protein
VLDTVAGGGISDDGSGWFSDIGCILFTALGGTNAAGCRPLNAIKPQDKHVPFPLSADVIISAIG